jgi:transcription elongation GreA/GreB family factor
MRLPTRKSELERLQRQEIDNYLTPAKIERMKQELEDLVKNKRRPAADEVARTAQMGDLSENAAYQFAKQNLRRINDRITMLEERLKQAIPINQSIVDGKIRIGSTVTLLHNNQTLVFEILGSSESDPMRGRISYKSPLGATLIGHVVGDHVTVATARGDMTYEILKVE